MTDYMILGGSLAILSVGLYLVGKIVDRKGGRRKDV